MPRRHPRPLAPGEVIAERTYELVTESGDTRPVLLRVGKPRPDPQDDGSRGWTVWLCPVEIEGLHEQPRRFEASGDSISALTEALSMAHMRLRSSDAYRDGRLFCGGRQELGLPDWPHTGNVDVARFFEGRQGYRALFATLIDSNASYPAAFRRLLGKRLSVPLGRRLDVVTGLSLGTGADECAVDIVCYPNPSLILALELVLDAAGDGDADRKLRALVDAEQALAREDGRPPRAVHLALIGAAGANLAPRAPNAVTALPWDEVFALFDRCDYLEGSLQEQVFTTLCRAAASRVPPVDLEPPALSFPVGERIFEALRQARAGFQGRLDVDPELAGTVWNSWGVRLGGGAYLDGWFRPEVPPVRTRALSVESRAGKNGWSVRIQVIANRIADPTGPDPGWPARRDELLAQAEHLSWRPERRRDRSKDGEETVGHTFEVTDLDWPPRVGEEQLAGLVVEGLMAYARVFHAFLRSDR